MRKWFNYVSTCDVPKTDSQLARSVWSEAELKTSEGKTNGYYDQMVCMK